jgi:hypothetical protein
MLAIVQRMPWDGLARRLGVGLALMAGFGGSAAEACRIRHQATTPSPTKSDLSFEAFLKAGPHEWSHATPRIPHGTPLQVNPDGTAKPSLFLDYLCWQRTLNPTKFDASHRHIAAIVARACTTPTTVSLPTPTIPPATQVVCPPLVPPQQQTVPEPSTALFAGLAIVGTVVWRRQRAGSGGGVDLDRISGPR